MAELAVTADDDTWWPSWSAMAAAGLTFTVDLGPIQAVEIAALYVVGVGEADAAGLLQRHLDSGDLGLLRPGAPTNTVAGAPAADLGQEAAEWRALAGRSPDGVEYRIGLALLADLDQTRSMVGDRDPLELHDALVLSLWSGLAGHGLREAWAVPALTVAEAQRWALSYLYPEGPLAPVRIGRQPYGLWPVSVWDRWDASDGPGPLAGLEEQLVPRAWAATLEMAARAETGLGTVVGADEDRLWDLLAQTPTADAYELRLCQPVDLLRAAVDPGDRPRLDDWWARTEQPAEEVAQRRLDDGMVALGSSMPLPRLGLVLPPLTFAANGLPLFLTGFGADPGESEALLTKAPAQWWAAACRWLTEQLFRDNGLGLGDVLLRPQWMPACLLWRLLVLSGSIALDHALREAAGTDGPLAPGAPDLLTRIMAGRLPPGNGPAARAYEMFRKGVDILGETAVQVVPGADQDFVDQLSRVVRGVLDTATHRADPWLTGAASRRLDSLRGSPRPIGLYGWVDQPLTGRPGPDTDVGLLLAPSDAQARTAVVLRDKAIDDAAGRWHMDLTSASIRAAVRLGDEVRAGAHPTEALGREVERLVGERATIDVLRAHFPVRAEHAGRRTCDGLQVLDAVLAAPPGAPPVDPGLQAAALPAAVIEQLRALSRTIDAHADLLLAEAVHHAVAGRPEAAAPALDAAAGLAPPPELDVVATPSRGRAVRTTVLTVLAPAPLDPAAPAPVAVATPAVAAWLDRVAGDAAGPDWTWTVSDPAGDRTVALAEVGLTPADALVVDGAGLDALVAARAGVDPGAVLHPAGPAAVRDAAAVLGERPLQAADLGLDPAEAPAFDEPVRLELEARLAALEVRAGVLADRLEAPADDADRDDGLVQAARWAIHAVPGLDADARAADAAAALRARLAEAPAVPGSTTVDGLIAAIVALVAPRARLPLLVTAAAPLPGVGPLTAEETGAGGRPVLDETWLELIAAVRPPLARLEAHQAIAAWTGASAWSAATSHPADPWATAAAALPRSDPTVPLVAVAYGPDPIPAGGDQAWSVLDRYAEVIPAEEHSAAGALRFNAPAAQAPQAILLAVPARPDERVDAEAALAIVHQARTVAHARMARAEDLGRLDLLLPVFPGLEEGGFHYRTPAERDG